MQNNPRNIVNKGNVVISWTGGKDCCYALYLAQSRGYSVSHLLHFQDLKQYGSHNIDPLLLDAQSGAIGIPIIHTDFYSYEKEFIRIVSGLRENGTDISGAVFGHIETHRELVCSICRQLHIDPIMPLWKQDSGRIIHDMLDKGFEMVIASVNADILGKEWLGRVIDNHFLSELQDYNDSVDSCGENGEFHTFVTDGPNFRYKMKIIESENFFRNGYWFMDITKFANVEK